MNADLRLFGPALGAWAMAILALWTPASGGVAAAAGLASAAALLAWRTLRSRAAAEAQATTATRVARSAAARVRRRTALRWAVVATLLGAAAGGLSSATRTAARDAEPLAGLAAGRATVQAEVIVRDDPRALGRGSSAPPTYLVPVRLVAIERGTERIQLDARVLVFGTGEAWRSLLPSTRLRVTGRLASARGGDLTAAVLSAAGTPETIAGPSWLQRAAGRLRTGLQAACVGLPPEPAGVLPGLVIGDTSRLDPAVDEEFRQTGLTHLTAVSGANLAIVLTVLLFALRWCRVGPVPSAAVCGFALAGFVVLARPSPSVVRAAAMGAIGLVALASGRPRLAAPALAAAVIVGLVIDPALAVDAGFALSVLATGALILLAPRWCDALRSRGVPAGLAAAIAAPAAAQLACGPVIAALSGGVSLIAVPANLAADVAVAPATVLGLGAAVVSPLSSGLAAVLAWCASWPVRWLVAVAHAGARVPAGTVPWPAGLRGAVLLATASVGLLLAVRRPRPRRVVLAALLAAAVGAFPLRVFASGWPAAGAVVIACDVGQGDALVLPVAPGQAVVVDAGPDAVLVDGCLSRLGVHRVPLLVLTHFHADHVDGIAGVLRHRVVDRVVAPDFDEPDPGYREVALAGRPVTTPGPGWTYRLGGLTLTLLGPIRRQTGTHSDPNNNSLVLRATSGSVSILLAGDAEAEEQHDLLGLGPGALHADVLKLAHHGSSYQDEEFLAAVNASIALVSVGEGNPYGHPNSALLDRLARQGVRVMRTDRDGDLAVVANGGRLGVVARGRSHK